MNYTHVITILCVYKCVTWIFYFLAIVYHIIYLLLFVVERRLIVWSFESSNSALKSFLAPLTRPVLAVCFIAVKEMATDHHKWSSTLFSECLTKTGHRSSSHENKSVYAEIRELLKIHLNSSQAPLVANSSTGGGHGRHSYWLILSALAHFKWVTKSGARHDAECAVSVLSLTVPWPFRVAKPLAVATLRARRSHFSNTHKILFAGFVDYTSSSLSKNHLSWMVCQYWSAAMLNTSSLTKHPASFKQGSFKMPVMHSHLPWERSLFTSGDPCSSTPVFQFRLNAAVITLNRKK